VSLFWSYRAAGADEAPAFASNCSALQQQRQQQQQLKEVHMMTLTQEKTV
jgi:hypothetical protein